MVSIALYKPQIPPNTGNIARLCVSVNGQLYIVGKPSFQMDSSHVRRAGLDYWGYLNWTQYPRWKNFILETHERRKIIFSKEGKNHLWEFNFLPGDILVFGNEGHGLPPKVLNDYKENSVRIPMWGKVRSHNLSNSVAIAVYEYLRKLDETDIIERERNEPYLRNYYKKKV